MPVYEVRCEDCNRLQELFMKINPEEEILCPECGGKMNLLISNTTFILKGTGWYATDYRNNSPIDDGGKPSMEGEKGKNSGAKEAVPST